jgi:hypothetical protein
MNELMNSLMAMSEQYGSLTVIEALNELLAMEVEQDACCVTCQRKAIWWHENLSRLITLFEKKFPTMQAVTRLNHPGSALVQ